MNPPLSICDYIVWYLRLSCVIIVSMMFLPWRVRDDSQATPLSGARQEIWLLLCLYIWDREDGIQIYIYIFLIKYWNIYVLIKLYMILHILYIYVLCWNNGFFFLSILVRGNTYKCICVLVSWFFVVVYLTFVYLWHGIHIYLWQKTYINIYHGLCISDMIQCVGVLKSIYSPLRSDY